MSRIRTRYSRHQAHRIVRRGVAAGVGVVLLALFFVQTSALGQRSEALSPVLAAGLPAGGSNPQTIGSTQHLVLMIVYATVALVFSFLCSVAEAVLLSVTPSYVAQLEQSGSRSAKRLSKVKEDIDRSLAAILTLNTIAHTVGAGGAGAEAAAYFGDRYVGIAMAVLTLLILFLSEIIPKTLGALNWRVLAPSTATFVVWLIRLLYPLILLSELITRWISRGQQVHAFSREEFQAMADLGAEAGHLDATESRIVNNLIRFPSLCAEDIMTPRTVVFALDEKLTVADVLERHPKMSFSRIPVYAGNRDEVTGFVLKADILLNQHHNEGRGKLRDLKREIGAVHEETKLSQILDDLLNHKAHILLVVDDYGGMEGILTLEDVVETLIGMEIVDEVDQIDDMRHLARRRWEERMRRVGIDLRDADSTDEEASDESREHGSPKNVEQEAK